MAEKINQTKITNIEQFANTASYSLLESLNCDPHATADGIDFQPRQVFSGHYVPVQPTAIDNPVYIAHSAALFNELGLDNSLAQDPIFKQLFSGDTSQLPEGMNKLGWATGYALSIYGTEYNQQCPFQTGNGYGDGRAMSIFEGVFEGKRWEMQLKGGGPTPYCRGADGRAVLRSSVREFLAQEYMHALGVPTSRSLSLFASTTETVSRPWYTEGSRSEDPDIMVDNPVAISTRVAPSFLRVGQLELFGRRARTFANPNQLAELKQIVSHIIEREYRDQIDASLPLSEQIVLLASHFSERLSSLIANWLRVGFCQGNFNSDNCAIGGFTLDYGPFGFCEHFEPFFQPWTGGGRHFSFFNQPAAAQKNFESFCGSLEHLLKGDEQALAQLEQLQQQFGTLVQHKVDAMWASKLGLETADEDLLKSLFTLMMKSHVDYTIFFRELSSLPKDVSGLGKCFYTNLNDEMAQQWNEWLSQWHGLLDNRQSNERISSKMKLVNPKYTWREWLIVPAYQQAAQGDYTLIQELQQLFAAPYDEQSQEFEEKYYRLKPLDTFNLGGVSHYSCSS
ncbi:YdiU family protein [Paraferrimonas sp. SM1919]|uniref:protein adenylyltransferase SelO n=1 Tax=Paraferrimonas sp. SM1919 TaxID=2662263 RepID=UPI0013D27099|nr:protein adenylyltransferase SelO family protein [Paraferrimonas sp. SM1919]